MEQWHQKLHNNTTPDDVAICEAYLNFLDGGGDAGAYWATLSDAGIVSVDVFLFDFDPGAKKKTHFFPLLLRQKNSFSFTNNQTPRTAQGSSRSTVPSPASPKTFRTRGRGWRPT